MKRLLAMLLAACLLTACSPRQAYNNFKLRQAAEELAKGANALAYVTVGNRLPAYEMAGSVYTDYVVSVVRGTNVKRGDELTIRRHGGSIAIPGTDQIRLAIVDYIYPFPEQGGDVFLLLRKAGEKYEIIDAMTVREGRPVLNRPEDQVYARYFQTLK